MADIFVDVESVSPIPNNLIDEFNNEHAQERANELTAAAEAARNTRRDRIQQFAAPAAAIACGIGLSYLQSRGWFPLDS